MVYCFRRSSVVHSQQSLLCDVVGVPGNVPSVKPTIARLHHGRKSHPDAEQDTPDNHSDSGVSDSSVTHAGKRGGGVTKTHNKALRRPRSKSDVSDLVSSRLQMFTVSAMKSFAKEPSTAPVTPIKKRRGRPPGRKNRIPSLSVAVNVGYTSYPNKSVVSLVNIINLQADSSSNEGESGGSRVKNSAFESTRLLLKFFLIKFFLISAQVMVGTF